MAEREREREESKLDHSQMCVVLLVLLFFPFIRNSFIYSNIIVACIYQTLTMLLIYYKTAYETGAAIISTLQKLDR
jgi:hypothetical protein